MSKSILVLDTPEDCMRCRLCSLSEWSGLYICSGTHNETAIDDYLQDYAGSKPNWCPLKPMPHEREEKDHYDFGWNDCVRVLNDDYNLCKLG